MTPLSQTSKPHKLWNTTALIGELELLLTNRRLQSGNTIEGDVNRGWVFIFEEMNDLISLLHNRREIQPDKGVDQALH